MTEQTCTCGNNWCLTCFPLPESDEREVEFPNLEEELKNRLGETDESEEEERRSRN